MAFDIYVGGFVFVSGDYQWRIEKRNKITGANATAFGADGVIQTNPSIGQDYLYSIAVDTNYVYQCGSDYLQNNSKWRLEKREKTTGALVTEFDNDGVIQSNPSTNHEIGICIALDSSFIYMVGYDVSPGNSQFRVEKYKNHVYSEKGIYTSPIIDASSEDNVIWSTISWDSEVLPPETMVKFQLATNNDGTTWDYLGPDGTEETYYETASGQPIWSGMSGKKRL